MVKVEFVLKRSGVIVPFTPERITNAIYRAAVAVGGRDRAQAEKLSLQVVQILEELSADEYIPTVEQIQDIVEKVLIENGHAKVAKAYILYRDERARIRKERAAIAARPSENIPWAKIWHVLDWAVTHRVNTIPKLNDRITQGEFSLIVEEAESAYNEDIENASELIASKKNDLKIVIIAGPSSSGKTTTTIKIKQRLERIGLHLVALNVDNYFFDLEMHPKDEFGDYDFETPQALDLELINKHICQLVDGEQVNIPRYDFKTGRRVEVHTPMKLESHQILLIDSLHGLYPAMMHGVPDEMKFRLYLEPLMQMKDTDGDYVRWTDIRLIRRMLRDAVHRAYDPRQTLEHWHYVRTSEMRNIIPHLSRSNYIVNTAMPYELAIYSARMRTQFDKWVETYQDDPLREDAYIRALRVSKLLQAVVPVDDETLIPPYALIREFIGGSCYQY